jgi:hypothetical protein
MYSFSMGVVLLVSVGIIFIGFMYLARPRMAAKGFGLPLPEAGSNTDWWLRLKGVRDVVSGLIMLALLTWSNRYIVGIALLVQALTPLGDMFTVLLAKGGVKQALGIHGLTATLMILAALPLIIGVVR